MVWKKGRGKLGAFDPLLGIWQAEAQSEMGLVTCQREFIPVLGGKFIQLRVQWIFGDRTYEELALIGVNPEKEVCFWSFTSDGKQSEGKLANVSDIHPDAIGFEAQMPAGLARQAYWPAEGEGFQWVVESKNKSGWNRFLNHHYTRLLPEGKQ